MAVDVSLNVVVDREKAALLGISETDVANAVLFSLNGSSAENRPIIYTDPQNERIFSSGVWLLEEHRKDLTNIEYHIDHTSWRTSPA